MDILKELAEIAGAENVTADPAAVSACLTDLSLEAGGRAEAVVCPGTAEEVSRIVKWANENDMPLVPVSSPVHLYGNAIPKQGGVVVSMKRFDQIHEIDTVNRFVRFGTGVPWEKLTKALAEKGMRVIMPLAPRGDRSVASDHLEREVTTNMVYDYGEPTQSMEVIFPNGDIFRTGSASTPMFPYSLARGANPAGPGLDFYRLLQCAQGTMGIITWMSLKIQSIPKIDRIKFAALDDINDGIDFLYRILPRRIGQECLILDRNDLAALISGSASEAEAVKKTLPPYTLILVISGLVRRPEEKIAYEEHFLSDVCRNEFPKIKLTDALPGHPGAGSRILGILREPWPADKAYWKSIPAGAYQDLFFITKPEKTQGFIDGMKEVCAENSYPFDSIGIYQQPIEHNRACQLMFSLFYDPEDPAAEDKIRKLHMDAFDKMLSLGGHFTRPYGYMAGPLYERAGTYTAALRKVKNLFDKNNIMNPGNLCF